jgi:hypothetical protein
MEDCRIANSHSAEKIAGQVDAKVVPIGYTQIATLQDDMRDVVAEYSVRCRRVL